MKVILVTLQHPAPLAAQSRHQVSVNRTVHPLAFGIELLLQFPQSLQESFQRPLGKAGKEQTENESEASLTLHHGLPMRSSRWYSRCWCCRARCPCTSGCRWLHRGRNHRWVIGCRHDVSSCRSERRGGGSGHHSGRVAGSRCGWSGGSGYCCNCYWRSSSCTGSKRGSRISCNLIAI
ncbi:unnamed protein product [Arctogadus glacialis]